MIAPVRARHDCVSVLAHVFGWYGRSGDPPRHEVLGERAGR